jgi:hypothetical protein
VLGLKGMIATDNMYPNTARIYTKDATRNADMPYDFFMSRYKEAYLQETMAFVKCLTEGGPVSPDTIPNVEQSLTDQVDGSSARMMIDLADERCRLSCHCHSLTGAVLGRGRADRAGDGHRGREVCARGPLGELLRDQPGQHPLRPHRHPLRAGETPTEGGTNQRTLCVCVQSQLVRPDATRPDLT